MIRHTILLNVHAKKTRATRVHRFRHEQSVLGADEGQSSNLLFGLQSQVWPAKVACALVTALATWSAGVQASLSAPSASSASAVPGFRYQAVVEPANDEPLVRLTLPAWALAGSQTADGRDIQVFNAAGESLPVHVFNASAQPGAAHTRSSAWLESLQSEATASVADAVKSIESSVRASTPGTGVSLHIAPGAAPVDVHIHTQSPTDAERVARKGDASGHQPLKNTVLFDVRHVGGQWNALYIKARLPANQAIDVRLESSTNLRDWQTVVAGAAIYQLQQHQQAKGEQLRISWPQPFASQGQFLRLRWQPVSGEEIDAAQAPQILAVQLEHTSGPASSPVLAWSLPAPVLNEDGSLQWGNDAAAVAGAWPAQALRLRIIAPGNHYVPVLVQARAAKQQAWQTVQYATLWRTQGHGSADTIELPLSATWPQWRLQTRGQQALQALGLEASLLYSPQELIFLRSGAGPYTLVSGSFDPASIKALRLQPAELTHMHARWKQLPLSDVGTAQEFAAPKTSAWQQVRPRNEHEKRQALLWAVLAVGLVVLAGVAWLLHRQVKPS